MERKSKSTTAATTITTAQAADIPPQQAPPQQAPPLPQTSTPIRVLRFVETSNQGDEKVIQQVLLVPTHFGNDKSIFEAMVVAKQKRQYAFSG